MLSGIRSSRPPDTAQPQVTVSSAHAVRRRAERESDSAEWSCTVATTAHATARTGTFLSWVGRARSAAISTGSTWIRVIPTGDNSARSMASLNLVHGWPGRHACAKAAAEVNATPVRGPSGRRAIWGWRVPSSACRTGTYRGC